MKIFVGNLSFAATEADVAKVFEGFGSVASVKIVMEKKGTKSRGFGFVDMPDDQQAQAAISALAGKELMGRPINVSPARPKPEVEREKGEAKEFRSEVKAKERKDAWFDPVFRKKGGYTGYKQGRRSRSFMKRRTAAGIDEGAMPKRENRENPMRWRKKYEQPKPGQKSQGGPKPWKKSGGEFKPWRKAEGEHKPWKKKEGEFKPWRKSAAESKPWRKSAAGPKPSRRKSKPARPHESRIQSRRKPGGYQR